MNIKPFDTTIRTVFETGFYKIPRFQRPYSWDRGNIEEFWSDVIASDAQDYFIGSMVFYKPKSRDELQVVDGQQRLTTITILLAALRDLLADVGEPSLAKGVQGVIQRKDISDELRYVLLTETSYPYFQEHVQEFGEPDLEKEPSPEEEGIEGAYTFAKERLSQIVQGIDNDPSLSAQRKKDRIKKELQSVRDRLLALRVIVIQLDNEDDAYIIFETLNTRGKDLEPEDLVKNHLARLLPSKNADVDATRTRWNHMTRQIWESGASLDVSNYIHHFWLSREDYTSKKTLFKRIKASIDRSNAKQFLSDLEDGVTFYRRIFEPDAFEWTKEERTIERSLEALLIFRVRQPAPMLFALLRAYYAKLISLKQTRDTISTIEQFHFMQTAVASLSSSGGISMMYAAAARDLYLHGNSQQVAKHLQDFRSKLRKRVPERDVFNAGFLDLRTTSTDTRLKPLVRYVLGKVDEHLRPDKNIDYAKMTIEHLAPENPATNNGDMDVGKIGNLILVSAELNQRLKNRSFKDKKKLLQDAAVPLDPALKRATSWTNKEIEKRSMLLADLAFNQIWRA